LIEAFYLRLNSTQVDYNLATRSNNEYQSKPTTDKMPTEHSNVDTQLLDEEEDFEMFKKDAETPDGLLVNRSVLPGGNYAMAPNGKFVQPILDGEDEILKQLSGFYHQVKEAVKMKKELLPFLFDANEKRKSLLASNVYEYGNGQRVREFFDLEHDLSAGVYLVQLKREVKMVRGKAIFGLPIMTGVWTIRLPHCTADAGDGRGAEAHSPGDESDLSDRYSENTTEAGEAPSENGSIGGSSLKRPFNDLDLQTDQKRLRRNSTPPPGDFNSIRSGTNASNLDSVLPTASTHGS
jgi:hypothetical protein